MRSQRKSNNFRNVAKKTIAPNASNPPALRSGETGHAALANGCAALFSRAPLLPA
jgi:hypothetical protein